METIKIPNVWSAPMDCFTKFFKQTGLIFLLALSSAPIISNAQSSQAGTGQALAPVRGNYKMFASLSAAPKAANLDVDKLRFPF